MAINHYKGVLGEFDYDDKEFMLSRSERGGILSLQYIGKELDGSNIHIPEGIVRHNHMFSAAGYTRYLYKKRRFGSCRCIKWGLAGAKPIKEAPEIPDDAINCEGMFEYSLIEQPPVIPYGVENCEFMFAGCKKLQTPPVIPNSVKNCRNMFDECSEEVQKAGQWNIEHRGQDYYVDGPGKKILPKRSNPVTREDAAEGIDGQNDIQKGLGE